MSDAYEFNDKILKTLEKLLKGKSPSAKVGVLGDKNNRLDSKSNASIGVRHEFGLGVPVRSFLRMPLNTKLNAYLKKSGALDKKAFNKILKDKSFVPYLKKVGLVAERVIQDAFDTGGFGEWPKSNMAYKKNHQTLVETQQLRNSITSRVDEE